MIQSQLVAKPRLGRPKAPLPWYMRNTNRKSLHTIPDKLHRQLSRCADPAARRLILGTSR